MPPELMDLYMLYKQELETRNNNEKENQFVSDLNNEIIKVSSLRSEAARPRGRMTSIIFLASLLKV